VSPEEADAYTRFLVETQAALGAASYVSADIGVFVAARGFRGVFPWAANYDALGQNNSLIDWLARGLGVARS